MKDRKQSFYLYYSTGHVPLNLQSSPIFSVHIINQQADRYIMAFHITIS